MGHTGLMEPMGFPGTEGSKRTPPPFGFRDSELDWGQGVILPVGALGDHEAPRVGRRNWVHTGRRADEPIGVLGLVES